MHQLQQIPPNSTVMNFTLKFNFSIWHLSRYSTADCLHYYTVCCKLYAYTHSNTFDLLRATWCYICFLNVVVYVRHWVWFRIDVDWQLWDEFVSQLCFEFWTLNLCRNFVDLKCNAAVEIQKVEPIFGLNINSIRRIVGASCHTSHRSTVCRFDQSKREKKRFHFLLSMIFYY